mgnify:CR=1 FL=1
MVVLGAAGLLRVEICLASLEAATAAGPRVASCKFTCLMWEPVEGDSILIIAPGGKTVLIDAGDTGKGKVILEALKRYNVQQLDYFVATHPHPDHIGGADEVFKVTKVLNVIDNGLPPDLPESLIPKSKPANPTGKKSEQKTCGDQQRAVSQLRSFTTNTRRPSQKWRALRKALPGAKLDLGDGARLTVLAPSEPFFTKDQMKAGGNVTNANSRRAAA